MQKLSPIEINEICDELGQTYPKSIEQVHGGDIHNAWRIEFSNKKLFLKRNIRNKKFLIGNTGLLLANIQLLSCIRVQSFQNL